MPRITLLAAACATLLGCATVTACTSSVTPSASPAPTRTVTATRPGTPVSAPPLASGPTSVARASACPFVAQSFVRDTIGMRLGRVTVLRARGRTVGCRIYALQGTALARSEHLPGPDQPAVEITTTRYPSAAAAHNAFVRSAEQGRNPQQDRLGSGVTAACFQTDFDPHDHGTDWACAFSTGTTAVLVRTVVVSPALDAVLLARELLRAL